MAGFEAADGADGGAGGHGDFGGFPSVVRLVAASILLDGAFVAVDLLMFGAGQAVDDAWNFNHGAVGENHGGKVHVELRFFGADAAAGANDAVDDALNVDAGWNDDATADHNGESGVEIDSVAGLGGFGVDGTAGFKKDLGSGGNVDEVDGWCGGRRWCGRLVGCRHSGNGGGRRVLRCRDTGGNGGNGSCEDEY